MDTDVYLRVLRVKLFLLGHSFDEIDTMSLQDAGDVFGYWREERMVNERMAAKRKSLSESRKNH
jgi:hypothetical protein